MVKFQFKGRFRECKMNGDTSGGGALQYKKGKIS